MPSDRLYPERDNMMGAYLGDRYRGIAEAWVAGIDAPLLESGLNEASRRRAVQKVIDIFSDESGKVEIQDETQGGIGLRIEGSAAFAEAVAIECHQVLIETGQLDPLKLERTLRALGKTTQESEVA